MLVFGDLPPLARDLDVLVGDGDVVAVETALRSHGFVGHGHAWVRFRGDDAAIAVDLFAASSWRLPEDELAAVFDAAEAVDGLPPGIVRPAAHHRVLLLARRLHWGGAIDERRRKRLDDALASSENVAALARQHAAAWRLAEPLELLLSGVTEPPAPPPPEKRRWRSRRRVLVALSGIDGSGKSSLAHGLVDVLGGLGIPATVVWSRLEWSTLHENRALGWIAAPAKAVVRLVARDAGSAAPEPPRQRRSWEEVDVPRGNADAASRLRERSPLLTTAWTTIVAALHAREQRRTVTGHDGVVISDRYTLDSAVHLRRAYAPQRRLPIANRVLALLSPRPDIALFLDVPARVALARKQDAFGEAELERHAAMYREEYAATGVRRVDASGPAAELLDEVAREVWLATNEKQR